MKFSVSSFARVLLAFALVVSVPSCDGIDKDSENTETPDDNGEEEVTPPDNSEAESKTEADVSLYSDEADFYFSNDFKSEDQVAVKGLDGKSVKWIDIDEYIKSGYGYKYLKISENMSGKDRKADAVITRNGEVVFTYHITQGHEDSYGYDPSYWEIIGSGNIYASFTGGSYATMWNNRNMTLLEGTEFVSGIGMINDRYLYSCALAKGKDFRTIIYKDGVQTEVMENCNATDFTVSGISLYTGGSWSENKKEYPAYWCNGDMTDLSENKTIEGRVSCITVDGNVVYTGGTNCMWKNFERNEMPHDGYDSAYVTEIVVDGSDVYASGYLIKDEENFRACWWLDGALHLLDIENNSGNSIAAAILRHDGKTYIGGYVDGYRAALWTDGKLKRLTSYNGHVNALAARGKDEVFAAGDKDGYPIIWRVRSRYAGETKEIYMNTSEDGLHNDDMHGNVTGIIVCAKR